MKKSLLQPSRTLITSLQFEQDGDVITADSDGFITIYSVDADGAYFVRMEYEAHNKGVGSLIMLSEGTLLSGGEKDRRIAAWDSLQNYKKITDTKVRFLSMKNYFDPHFRDAYTLCISVNINFFPLIIVPFGHSVYTKQRF